MLLAVAEKDPEVSDLPLSFDATELENSGENASWVATRLQTYAELEGLRVQVLSRGPTMEIMGELVRVLGRAGFVTPTANAVSELTEYMVHHGAPQAALMICRAAANGPHPKEICAGFRQLADAVEGFRDAARGVLAAKSA